MKGFSASLDMGDARIEIIKSVPKNIKLSKDLFHQIPWSTECLNSTLNFLRVCWRSTAIAARGLISMADGKCLCFSVVDSALGKCQFVVDIRKWLTQLRGLGSPMVCELRPRKAPGISQSPKAREAGPPRMDSSSESLMDDASPLPG